MANSFQQAQQEALGLLNKIQSEVVELDKQLISTANNLVKMFKFGGAGQTQNQIKLVSDENPDKLEFAPAKLITNLVKAVQELSAQITALQSEISTLKGE